MWGTLKNWKILLSLFTTLLIGWNVLTQKETTFQNRIWIHFVSLTCFLWVAKFSVWLKAQPFQRDESVLPQNSRKYNSFCLDHYLINLSSFLSCWKVGVVNQGWGMEWAGDIKRVHSTKLKMSDFCSIIYIPPLHRKMIQLLVFQPTTWLTKANLYSRPHVAGCNNGFELL